MVVPVPLALVVQGKKKEVVALEPFQHGLPVDAAGNGVAQRPGQPVKYRRTEQELSNVIVQMGKHLIYEVLDDVLVVACEASDEVAGFVTSLQ